MPRRRHHPRRQMTCNPHLLLCYFWPTYSMPPIASYTSSRQLCICVCVSVQPIVNPCPFLLHRRNNAPAARFRVRGITSRYGPARLFYPRLYTIRDIITGKEGEEGNRFRDKRGQFLRRYNRTHFEQSALRVPGSNSAIYGTFSKINTLR